MQIEDSCVTLVPYFRVREGKLDAFKALCEKFVQTTRSEPRCMFYSFTFNGHDVHCREGYDDAEGLLEHIAHVGAMIEEALKISEITRIEAHGPASELAKLKGPLTDLAPVYYELTMGFRRAA